LRTALPRRASRASQPGSRGTPRLPARYAWSAFFCALAVLAAAAGLYLTRSPGAAAAQYGGLPSWLPTSTIPVGRVVTASPAHPWLAAEGDTVRVMLPGSQLLATAVGPAVPEEGQFPVPATTPCTFTITLAGVSGAVPLRTGAFTIRDEQGRVHHLQVAGLDGRPAPAVASAGKTVTVTLKTVLPTGSGELQWAPQGAAPVVSWDFDVEID